MKLQTFLMRLIAGCLLPLLLLGGWLAVRHVQLVRAEQVHHAEGLAHNAATSVDLFMRARMATLQVLATAVRPSFPEGKADLDGASDLPVYLVPTEVLAFGPSGMPGRGDFLWHLPDFRPRPGSGLSPEVQALVRSALTSKLPEVGWVHDEARAQVSQLALVVPGVRQDAAVFALVAFIPLRHIDQRLAMLAQPEMWQVHLLDLEGRVLADSDPANAPPTATVYAAQARSTLGPWSVAVKTGDPHHASLITRTALAMLLMGLGATAVSVLGGRWAATRLTHSVASLTDEQRATSAPLDIREVQAARSRLDQADLAVQVRDAQLRAIFDSASDAIVTVDPSQRVVMANAAAARMFGRPMEALVGAPLEELIPGRFRERHRVDVEAFSASDPAPRPMGRRPDIVGLRANGEEFPAEAAISHVHVDGQRLSTAIVRDVTPIRKVLAELEASHADLQHLIAAKDSVQEVERARIARELHDDLQQTLAAILMEVTAMRGGRETVGPLAQGALDRIDALSTAAIASTRRIIHDLRPQMLEALGLVPALRQLAAQFSERHGVVCEVDDTDLSPGAEAGLAPVATCLYRVAQEALNNVAKHAGARRVTLRLARLPPEGLRMSIVDDGVGLAAGAGRRAGSFGLLGMGERVRAIGGHLDVRGEPGRGTTVEVRLAHFQPPPQCSDA